MATFMATLRQRIGWKVDKIKRSLKWPARAVRAFRRLYTTMGPKGVFWYMAIQGRWHYGLTLFLCLLTVAGFYGALTGLVGAEGAWYGWLLAMAAALIAGFFHYVLWRRSVYMSAKKWMFMTRLYVAPVLVLSGVVMLGGVLKVLFDGVKVLTSLW